MSLDVLTVPAPPLAPVATGQVPQRLAPDDDSRPARAASHRRDTPLAGDLEGLLADFEDHEVAVRGQAERSAESYRRDTRCLLHHIHGQEADLTLADITAEHLARYFASEQRRGIAATTRKRALYAFRSFFAWALDPADPTDTPAHRLPQPKTTTPPIEPYSKADIDCIFTYGATCTALASKVAFHIVATLYGTGLRKSEVRHLTSADVDLDARRLQITGKGNQHRLVPLPPWLADMLATYLVEIRPACPGNTYLFSNPNSEPDGPHLGTYSSSTLHQSVVRFVARAGLTGKTNMHRWRHTYATTVLRSGSDVMAVQRLLGHRNIATTLGYLHLVDDDLLRAVDHAFPHAPTPDAT